MQVISSVMLCLVTLWLHIRYLQTLHHANLIRVTLLINILSLANNPLVLNFILRLSSVLCFGLYLAVYCCQNLSGGVSGGLFIQLWRIHRGYSDDFNSYSVCLLSCYLLNASPNSCTMKTHFLWHFQDMIQLCVFHWKCFQTILCEVLATLADLGGCGEP